MKGNWMEWPGQNKAKNRLKRVRPKVPHVSRLQKKSGMTLNKVSMNMGLIQGYVPVAVFVFESKG